MADSHVNRGYVLLKGGGKLRLAQKINEIIKALEEIKADFNGHTHLAQGASSQTAGPIGRSIDFLSVEELMP